MHCSAPKRTCARGRCVVLVVLGHIRVASDLLCCTAQLGLNRFADMTEAEFRAAYLGYSSRRNPLLTCAACCELLFHTTVQMRWRIWRSKFVLGRAVHYCDHDNVQTASPNLHVESACSFGKARPALLTPAVVLIL